MTGPLTGGVLTLKGHQLLNVEPG